MLGTGEAALPLITEPRFRRPPQPAAYPPQSVRRNEAGTALIRARISSLGDVVEANVFQSSGYALLDKSAIAAVRRWMFVPEQRGGHASEAWVQIPVHFRLQD
jgi:protein TonB